MTTNVKAKTRTTKSSGTIKARRDLTKSTRSAGTRNIGVSRRSAIEVYKSIYWRENNEDDAAYTIRRFLESMEK